MRDYALLLIVFASVPATLVQPQIGILMWFWISIMNVQQYTWNIGYELRPALVVGGATLIGWLLSRDPKRPPGSPVVIFLGALTFWMAVAAAFAIHPDVAIPKWEEYTKILLMTFVAICIVQSERRVNQLVWILVISLGFYGVKGGLFTLLSGGNFRVWGPPGTFIEDNNALACALTMGLPLIQYLRTVTQNRLLRWGLAITMGLTVLSIVGSYSRGALLSLMVMMAFLAMKTRHRVATVVITIGVFIAALMFVPQTWYDRMATIETYQQDESAQGRFDAWNFAFRLALDHPLTGGGYSIGEDEVLFDHYVPTAPINRAAHSIYFQILGETGFVGLAIYLLLLISSFLAARNVVRLTKDRPDLAWARSLAAMLQVSIVGFAVGGAFLSLGFYDLYYALVALVAVTQHVVRSTIAKVAEGTDVGRVIAWRFPAVGAAPRSLAPATPSGVDPSRG